MLEDLDNDLSSLTGDDIFPTIKINDFYHLIKYKNGSYSISNEMLGSIIKSIISKMSTTRGEVFISKTRHSDTNIELVFRWLYMGTNLYKTYSIRLS